MRGLGAAVATVSSLLLLALLAELYYFFWRKKHRSPIRARTLTPAAYGEQAAAPAADVHVGAVSGDDPLKCVPISHNIDVELMRLHCLPGPPRFLFTIKEEVDGDGNSESSARTHSRSLRDLLHCQPSGDGNSPLRTPLTSPPLQLGINPLFDSSTSHSPPRSKSPPPKFNFLKEAEEKLQRRIALLEASRPQI